MTIKRKITFGYIYSSFFRYLVLALLTLIVMTILGGISFYYSYSARIALSFMRDMFIFMTPTFILLHLFICLVSLNKYKGKTNILIFSNDRIRSETGNYIREVLYKDIKKINLGKAFILVTLENGKLAIPLGLNFSQNKQDAARIRKYINDNTNKN
jgi:hypothetical protein